MPLSPQQVTILKTIEGKDAIVQSRDTIPDFDLDFCEESGNAFVFRLACAAPPFLFTNYCRWPSMWQYMLCCNTIEGKDAKVRSCDALQVVLIMLKMMMMVMMVMMLVLTMMTVHESLMRTNILQQTTGCSGAQCANPPNPSYLAQTPPIWPNFTPNPLYLPQTCWPGSQQVLASWTWCRHFSRFPLVTNVILCLTTSFGGP